MTPLLAAESSGNFVELNVHPWQWLTLLGIIVALLLVDLLVVHREAHADQHEGSGDRVGGVDLDRGRVLARRAVVVRWGGDRRVHLRLPHREEPEHRQRLRLGVDHGLLQGAPEVPAPRAVLGHLRRPRDAGDLHLRRRRADRGVRLGALHLRRVPDLHRRAHARLGGRGVQPGREQVHAPRQPGRAEHRQARRTAPVHRRSTASGWRRRCSPCSCSSSSPT